MDKLGVYIHIPFCESKCHYCDFTSGVGSSEIIMKYRDCIIKEISNFDSTGYIVDTIFIGGGTPTSVNINVISDIVTAIKNKFNTELVEFTIEGNPNSYTKEKVDSYIKLGVDRVSVGVQSLEDEILKSIGRAHNSCEAKECVDMLVRSGIRVSSDLMVGLPDQTLDIAVRDARSLVASGIKHVSCYALILEPNTKLHKMVMSGDVVLPTEDETVDMYDAVMAVLESGGLCRYEVSNFGEPCQHNLGYWNLKEYAGFGVSAHSFNHGVRYYNTDSLTEYLKGNQYIIDEEPTLENMSVEYIMLSLRLDKGIDVADFIAKYGESLYSNALIVAQSQSQYMDITNAFISIKRQYSYIANSIIEKFI